MAKVKPPSLKESVVVATLLTDAPDRLTGFLAKVLHSAPDSFDDKRLGLIASAIQSLYEAATPVGALTVLEHLGLRVNLVGGHSFVASLQAQAVTLDIAEFEAKSIWESYKIRRRSSVMGEAALAVNDSPEQSDLITRNVRATLDALDNEHSNGHFELTDSTAFLAQDLTKPPELVSGILHQGSKLVLGGGSKSFKTWSLLDLAVSVSHSRPWLGFDTRPGPVLYVNFEIQPWSWQDRIKSVSSAKSIELQPDRLFLLNLRGQAADFRVLLPKIKQAAGTRFVLIILDPIYKLYGDTDENSAGAVALLLNAIEDLCTTSGAASAFGAHYSKGNQASKESIDRISGSGVFARDPDSILSFTKHEEKHAFTVEPTLRNFAPVDPFVVRWFYPLMSRDTELDPAKLKKVGGRPQQHSPDDLLAILGDENLKAFQWLQKAKEDSGISERTFWSLKSSLQKLGKIQKSVVTGSYSRTV